jgi:Flp pilus assembly secretin CpaC
MAKAKTVTPQTTKPKTRRSKKPKPASMFAGMAKGIAWLGGKVRDTIGRKKQKAKKQPAKAPKAPARKPAASKAAPATKRRAAPRPVRRSKKPTS